MTAEKKLTVKRIIIFTLLAYLPPYILVPLTNYSITEANTAAMLAHLVILFSPAAAHILTRLITREGLTTEYLGLHLKGKMKYYALAVIIPVVLYLTGSVIVAYRYGENYSITDAVNSESWFMIICVILQYIGIAIALFFILMGEEYGWRAYLTPKLEEIMSEPAALIVSGIIWAMWHGPILDRGLNFGTGYTFFPWAGYIMMSVFCISIGSFFTWLVKKTGSLHSASISHSVIDFINSVLIAIFVGDAIPESFYDNPDNSFWLSVTAMLPTAAAGIVFMILLCRKKSSAQSA